MLFLPMSFRNTTFLLLLYLCCFIAGCRQQRHPIQDQEKMIGLQVTGSFDRSDLDYLQQEVHAFFRKKVVILPPIAMPAAYRNLEKGERYNALALIDFLKTKTNDSLVIIAGLTQEDIYTTIKDERGRIREPRYKYAVWGIFGLGYQPGKTCVISANRLRCSDRRRYQHRIRTVTLHEIGHNLGLAHCSSPRCIMSDANERIATIDQSSTLYCTRCREKTGL